MVQDEKLYQKVIADYRITNSVKKTAQNVGTSLVRAQRILITEGLWSSHTSEQVGELFRKGMTTSAVSDIRENSPSISAIYTNGNWLWRMSVI